MQGRFWSWVKLTLQQNLLGIQVPSSPHFHTPETTDWFSAHLRQCRGYLEYGSGGSTYLAAKHAVPFISVDSDRRFLRAVERKIEKDLPETEARRVFVHADIGPTARWGFPVLLGKASPARLRRFARYSDLPTSCVDGSFSPDFILVDGRFRVACALKGIRNLANHADWTIAVDDYTVRPHYGIIEKFAKLDRLVGRMAVFRGVNPHSAQELDEAIRRYETDPD